MQASTCLQRLGCLGLFGGLLCLLAGCSGSNESGEEPRGGPLSLQLRFAPHAVSASPSDGLAAVQVRQVEPGDPGFLERLEVRLQAQGRDLVPTQVFTLTAADQETVTQEVTLPDPVPATFQVLVSALTSEGIEVFRGNMTVARGQASAVVTLLRTALVPVPVTPATLAQRTFQFPDGTAFGLAQVPVTLATGTFTDTDTVGDFALVAHGLVASGHVELEHAGLGLCTFVVTTSAFPLGQGPQVGDRFAMHPCQSDAIDHRLSITNAASSTASSVSSPPVAASPESVILPPPFTLVTPEDTSGTVRFAVSLTGNRPGTTSLAVTTASTSESADSVNP